MSTINNNEHYIDALALQLDEDIQNADDELNEQQIHKRLMQAIVERCKYSIAGHIQLSVAEHEHQPALTLSEAATMIICVWLHKDRQFVEEVIASLPTVLPSAVMIDPFK
jgi:hypothetical protein